MPNDVMEQRLAEARYARERYDLYKARMHGASRPTSLEAAARARARLRAGRSARAPCAGRHPGRTRMTSLGQAVVTFGRQRRGALTAAASGAVLVALAIMIAGRWGEFAGALAGAPVGILVIAAGLQVASLLTRSESWKVCVRSAGGSVGRRRVYRAASVGYAASIVNGQLGFAMRIAALRRSAPKDSPKALALATTEVPILIVEASLAALFSFTLVGPLGWPWWVPLAAFAAMLSVLIGLRSVARHHLDGWWSGLAVMRETGARTRVIALVTLGVVFQIARNWLLLQAVASTPRCSTPRP